MALGKFYGVGVGPGDPELVTVKGARILREAEVVFYPSSEEKGDSLAAAIAADHVPTGKDRRELVFPMTKDPEQLGLFWSRAAEQVEVELSRGATTVFVTIGDPLLYSTYIYLLAGLKDRLPGLVAETIPGISAPFACAAAAGETLAEGREKLAVVPALGNLDQVPAVLRHFERVVLLKLGRTLGGVLDLLDQEGLLEEAVLIKRVGGREERIVRDLAGLRARLDKEADDIGYLSTLIVRGRGLPFGER